VDQDGALVLRRFRTIAKLTIKPFPERLISGQPTQGTMPWVEISAIFIAAVRSCCSSNGLVWSSPSTAHTFHLMRAAVPKHRALGRNLRERTPRRSRRLTPILPIASTHILFMCVSPEVARTFPRGLSDLNFAGIAPPAPFGPPAEALLEGVLAARNLATGAEVQHAQLGLIRNARARQALFRTSVRSLRSA
jgi:hypothetical protein